MNSRERAELDRHITGNWGEDSVGDEPNILEALEAARQFILDRSASERRREEVLAYLLETIEYIERGLERDEPAA